MRFNHPHHHRHFLSTCSRSYSMDSLQEIFKNMPQQRPKWLPKWIWREVAENYKAMEMDQNMIHSAAQDFENEYTEFEDRVSVDDLQDQWVDEEDGSEWIVSNDAVDDYDSEWNNDEEWDEINEEILTAGGKLLTRKCLHMWGHRLCLCQFFGLFWIPANINVP
eukprot:TRINITY_DN2309_c1_g1_i1.p1 TRINITY_DN2309_c1_g1~~TRINITY_DN2309_c1_g1_i1.p1  ORF type:complete len:164 (-),score=8.74 TRINITY_DN2309_c1_g1_i1:529-1020(-)